jgi:hypothetical protein
LPSNEDDDVDEDNEVPPFFPLFFSPVSNSLRVRTTATTMTMMEMMKKMEKKMIRTTKKVQVATAAPNQETRSTLPSRRRCALRRSAANFPNSLSCTLLFYSFNIIFLFLV